MIQKMKKFTFLVTNKEYDGFINEIRNIGVLHIEELQSGVSSQELRDGILLAERYKNVLKTLDFAEETYLSDTNYSMKPAVSELGMNILSEVERTIEEELKLNHELDAVEKEISLIEPWGEFDSSTLSKLSSEGYTVNFHICPDKMFKQEWIDKYFATSINEIKGKCYFVTFSNERPDITAENVQLPSEPLSFFLEQRKNIIKKLDDIHSKLYRIAKEEKDSVLAAQLDNENSISLSKVHLSTVSVADDSVKVVVGWTLKDKCEEILEYLDKNKIYYEMSDPEFEDDVPIHIKNDSYSSLFEPILKMYSLPNYHDIDPTPFFAPFFMLFFGLCMGDAGYGIIILLASILLKIKLKPEIKPYATLGVYLGIMTIVVGSLTGSFFGIDLSKSDWAFLAPIKPYFINDANFQLFGYSPMMVISVIIGLIQVLLGMILSAAKSASIFGWKYGIGKMSWVVALITGIIYACIIVANPNHSEIVKYVLWGILGLSGAGIFLYNSPNKNIFMNIGSGVWDTYGMATGLLGDLLSYIRLFALGLTGGILGGVFNQLAIEMTADLSWEIRWLPMLIILLLGHSINFALCMISSFVHPMRLTFVEFFKNASFDGGGKEYKPFRIKTLNK